MSNHYHIIATATEENLHRAMQYLNSRVAVRLNKATGRSGHLWADRYGSCIIDTDEYYLACVRYIYRNPKRAGMVQDLEEFPYSSFQFWAFGKKIDVFLADDHLVMRWGKGKRRAREYFKILVLDEGAGFTDEEVKKGLRRMFFGSADFTPPVSDTGEAARDIQGASEALIQVVERPKRGIRTKPLILSVRSSSSFMRAR